MLQPSPADAAEIASRLPQTEVSSRCLIVPDSEEPDSLDGLQLADDQLTAAPGDQVLPSGRQPQGFSSTHLLTATHQEMAHDKLGKIAAEPSPAQHAQHAVAVDPAALLSSRHATQPTHGEAQPLRLPLQTAEERVAEGSAAQAMSLAQHDAARHAMAEEPDWQKVLAQPANATEDVAKDGEPLGSQNRQLLAKKSALQQSLCPADALMEDPKRVRGAQAGFPAQQGAGVGEHIATATPDGMPQAPTHRL